MPGFGDAAMSPSQIINSFKSQLIIDTTTVEAEVIHKVVFSGVAKLTEVRR